MLYLQQWKLIWITSTMQGNNTYQHLYLTNLSRREKNIAKDSITNGYGALDSGDSLNTIHWDLATQYLNKETKRTVEHIETIMRGAIMSPNSKKIDRNLHIHSQMQTFHNWSRNWQRSCWWSFSWRWCWKQTFRGFPSRNVSRG